MAVLSLFNDYTDLLYISSASTILAASFLLQALTFWTLAFKKWLGQQFTYAENQKLKPAKFFSLWAVLFSSKFIFLWAIDVVFGEYVQLAGFLSLMLIIATMTVIKEVLFYLDTKLQY